MNGQYSEAGRAAIERIRGSIVSLPKPNKRRTNVSAVISMLTGWAGAFAIGGFIGSELPVPLGYIIGLAVGIGLFLCVGVVHQDRV
jgi:hypothetical protein